MRGKTFEGFLTTLEFVFRVVFLLSFSKIKKNIFGSCKELSIFTITKMKYIDYLSIKIRKNKIT